VTDEQAQPLQEEALSAEARQRVEELIEEEEGVHNRYVGAVGVLLTALAVTLAPFAIAAGLKISVGE